MPTSSNRRRRLTLAAVGACLMAAAACGGGSSSPTPFRPLSKGGGHKEILVLGGSIMRQTGVSLEAALKDTPWVSVHNAAASDVVGYGETGVVNLRAQWAGLVEKYRPDLVLAQITVSRARFHCGGPDAEQCLKDGLRYHVEIAMKDLVDTVTKYGARVVWVQFPVFDSDVDTQHELVQFNELVAGYAKLDPRLTLLKSSDVVTPGGKFTYWLKTPAGYRQVRKTDGSHLCPYGAELIAADLASKVVQGWNGAGGPWIIGPWRRDRSFTTSQEETSDTACDDSIHTTRPDDPVPASPVPPTTAAPVTTLPPVTVP